MIPRRSTSVSQSLRLPLTRPVGNAGYASARVATREEPTSTKPRYLVARSAASHPTARSIRSFATYVPDRPSTSRLPHFDKILIANRCVADGEIACRVMRTARKLGIKTVAVYSEVDKDSLHVQMARHADEAYCIGPAPSAESYVCHPYGFLSENAKFAEALDDEGILAWARRAILIVPDAGVPCVPGYHGEEQDPDFLYQQALNMGFPVLIKAIHGGGGKGMRAVTTPTAEAFHEALESAKRESRKAFGNDTVLVERYIQRPRHIEVQVFADARGNAASLWERDCSVQRRNQKIIEEAPAPGLSDRLRADLSAKAVAAAQAVHYRGAGTVEFIFDNDTEDFYFMEMNTRLQVEHPVTEMVTGLDLVEWQLEVAAGNALPLQQSAIPLVGHAFEARIYAENPRNSFLPDAGQLLYLSTPAPTSAFATPFPTATPGSGDFEPARLATLDSVAPTVRLEHGFGAGAHIGVFYDPMIAKLVVHGRDRTEALRLLRKALDEYHVVGVSTNVEFLRTLAGNEAFISEEVETGFIQKHFDDLFAPPAAPSAELLAKAALFAALRDHPAPKAPSASLPSPWSSLASRRFGGDVYERTIAFQTDESAASNVTVRSLQPGFFDVKVETEGKLPQEFHSVPARLVSATTLSTTLDGAYTNTTIVPQPAPPTATATVSERLHVFEDGRKTTLGVCAPRWLLSLAGDVAQAAKGALKAPTPSVVVDVRVKVGDQVKKNQAIVVLESMKTETVLRAPRAGTVRAVGCKNGEMVEEGRDLVDIDEDE
ncbi:carbamoyl-phosphate synthase L chain, ATP binding domain-containing protein [Schizophyllum amplum]|uniref:Carbamoyl-phosphate synthase L chain, ATP binding domain-containing protein n=1 Tax=Schizophyllum amplum TaxID=97359 RepID=A0A550C9X3_9AGAR|nr:carbamoyl-phosphate synthase L chain, ATP binding domain-containing protein [Auriculariopsis ampla]